MRRSVCLVVVLALTAACGGGSGDHAPSTEALLIVSMPGVGWTDIQRLDLPNIEAFAAEAAIGHMATRLGRRSAAIDASYLTIGAGTRALAPPGGDGGLALEPGERFGGSDAATLVERRVGTVPTGPAYLDVATAAERNARSSFGAIIGALGDALADAGVRRSVVANADSSLDPGEPTEFGRDAVAALMDAQGMVDGGAVGSSLLHAAPEAPWGLQLDSDAVIGEFEQAWDEDDRRVVLVEASDLRRAATYHPLVTPNQSAGMRDAALRRTDALVGRLIEAAGPRSAVILMSPVAPPGGTDLAMVAYRTPGSGAGLLRSATTRRTGYVQLADVAPTVLGGLGLDVAEDAEGRPFSVEPDGRSLDERVGALVTAAEQSRFRDSNLPLVVITIVLLLLALTVVAVLLWRLPRLATPTRRSVVRAASFFALGVVPATFVVNAVDALSPSTVVYALAVVALAALVTAGAWSIETRSPGVGAIAALGLVVASIAVDALVGAPLQVNAVFGYSVAVAGRFAGLGNLAFALLSAATLLLAVLLSQRFGARGRLVAIGVLVAVVIVDGLPMFGADVGGVLSMVPAFGVAALLLAGRRIRGLHIAGLAIAAFAVLFAAAFIDSARPPESRTHLARLAEHLTDGRWDRLFDSLVRRWAASFGGGELGAYVLLALMAFVTTVYVAVIAFRRRERSEAWRRLVTMSSPLRAASIGLSLLAILGLVANDSSVAVPATMLIVVVPVAVERSLDRLEGVRA